MDYDLISLNKKVARMEDDQLKAIGAGETDIQVKLKDCTDIEPDDLFIHIQVDAAAEAEFSCYIEGKDTIRLGQKQIYILKTITKQEDKEEETMDVSFSIDDTTLAKVVNISKNVCTIEANTRNKLNEFVLNAEYKGATYTKHIKVVPLW